MALISGFICISIFVRSGSERHRAWRPVLIALILFVIEQVIGGLRTFGIIENAGIWVYSVHVIVSVILALLIYAVALQIEYVKGGSR